MSKLSDVFTRLPPNPQINKLAAITYFTEILKSLKAKRSTTSVNTLIDLIEQPIRNSENIRNLYNIFSEELKLYQLSHHAKTCIYLLYTVICTDSKTSAWANYTHFVSKEFPRLKQKLLHLDAFFAMKMLTNNQELSEDTEKAFMSCVLLDDFQLAYDILDSACELTPNAKYVLKSWIK